MVVESMKMEIDVIAPQAGRITELRCSERKAVAAGQTMIVFRQGDHDDAA
jgi:urea carboxylase